MSSARLLTIVWPALLCLPVVFIPPMMEVQLIIWLTVACVAIYCISRVLYLTFKVLCMGRRQLGEQGFDSMACCLLVVAVTCAGIYSVTSSITYAKEYAYQLAHKLTYECQRNMQCPYHLDDFYTMVDPLVYGTLVKGNGGLAKIPVWYKRSSANQTFMVAAWDSTESYYFVKGGYGVPLTSGEFSTSEVKVTKYY